MKTKPIVFLRGKKTHLCPVDQVYTPVYTRWINDGEVTRYLTVTSPLNQASEWKALEKLAESKSNVILMITTLQGKPIGMMGIHDIRPIDGTATTGAFIGEKSYWNKGYGTDAKMQLLNYAFNTLNLRKICSRVYDFNPRSLAYSKHCGYKQEGVQKKHVFRDGEYRDVIELALFKEDWLPYWKKYQKGQKLP